MPVSKVRPKAKKRKTFANGRRKRINLIDYFDAPDCSCALCCDPNDVDDHSWHCLCTPCWENFYQNELKPLDRLELLAEGEDLSIYPTEEEEQEYIAEQRDWYLGTKPLDCICYDEACVRARAGT